MARFELSSECHKELCAKSKEMVVSRRNGKVSKEGASLQCNEEQKKGWCSWDKHSNGQVKITVYSKMTLPPKRINYPLKDFILLNFIIQYIFIKAGQLYEAFHHWTAGNP